VTPTIFTGPSNTWRISAALMLDTFGLYERPPEPRRLEEEIPARLWDEALENFL